MRELVAMLIDEEAPEIGVEPARVQIRDQRSRWGSCSTRGTLSFNWRLVLAPFDVLDYVVVHELCHLREPNHSRRFWKLVEQRRPDWRAQRDWLHEHGPELLAFAARWPRETEAALRRWQPCDSVATLSEPSIQSARGGEKTSTSSGVLERLRLVRHVRRDVQHVAGAELDDLLAVLAELEAHPSFEDPRDLLVLVRVLGHDAPLAR